MRATIEDLRMELWLRRRNNKEIVWITKQGEEIPIQDMEDAHLMNAINVMYKIEEHIAMQSEFEACRADLEDAGDR